MATTIRIPTSGKGLHEITEQVRDAVSSMPVDEGICVVFVQHTSASLTIQENADPDVKTDLAAYLHRLVPPSTDPSMHYLLHTYEGPDDIPAHIKAALLPVSLSIPVRNGRLILGTWQGIYLFEHRDAPQRRKVAAHLSP